MQRVAAAVGMRIIRARGRFLASRLARQSLDCRRTQERQLRRLLALNSGTQFQQDRGLAAGLSPDEFRRRLPITTYSDVAPYVERAKVGNFDSLCGRSNRPLMFAQTSGTTGDSKFIPVTRSFLADYRRGWTVWGYHAFSRRADIRTQKFLQISSDHDRTRTSAGIPCGNISGLVQSMQNRLVQTRYVVTSPVLRVRDPAAKSYLTLRLALAERNVGLILTANPSTLVALAAQAEAEQESLIRDVHDGTLADRCEIPDEVRRSLHRQLSTLDVPRAQELSRLAEQAGGLFPRDFWPDVSLIGVWTGGSAAAYLPAVRRLYGDVPIRDHGLSASEGRMTIPLEDETASGVLDVGSHFFEFFPEEQADEENPTTLLAHELTEGARYFILLTTASGLYRYNISDVVRCTGFLGTTPMLEFLHKGAHISSVTGEKLTESQVVSAVSSVCESFGLGLGLGHYTLTPVWGEPPGYRLLVEDADLNSPAAGEAVAAALDERLQRANCEYREKRATGRLAPLEVEPLCSGTWSKYISHQQSRPGASIEQYKHPCLKPDLTFRDEVLAHGAE